MFGTIEIIRLLNKPVSESEYNNFFGKNFYSCFWQVVIGGICIVAVTYVTQEMPSNIEEIMAKAERQAAYNAKHVVFRAHLYKCSFGDELPRGKFFKGKKPIVVIMDEFHSGFSEAELTIIENSK